MARQPAGLALSRGAADEYDYDGLETCAADGTCALACPLGIDTGKLVKELRAALHGPRASRAAQAVADHWGAVERGARAGLRAGEGASARLGSARLARAAPRVRGLADPELVPAGATRCPRPPTLPCRRPNALGPPPSTSLPASTGSSRRPRRQRQHPAREPAGGARRRLAAGRDAGVDPDGRRRQLLRRARGARRASPRRTRRRRTRRSSACGRGAARAPCRRHRRELLHARADRGAARCSATSTPSATERSRSSTRSSGPGGCSSRPARGPAPVGSIAVHPTCSSRHLGLDGALAAVAGALAEEVLVPPSASCCGFAGDRGLLHPELTAAATRPEAAEVAGQRQRRLRLREPHLRDRPAPRDRPGLRLDHSPTEESLQRPGISTLRAAPGRPRGPLM